MATEIRKVGVIGAGLMGNGIAHVAALARLDVVLMDVHAPALERALATIGKNLDRQLQKGGIQPDDREAALGRIKTATDNSRFGDCDLVIEAATEDEQVKRKIFAALCPKLRPRCADRHQHLLHPDHPPRRRDRPAWPLRGHALLQPGADDAPGRDHPRPGDGG